MIARRLASLPLSVLAITLVTCGILGIIYTDDLGNAIFSRLCGSQARN